MRSYQDVNMSSNASLHAARRAKNDEFYTRLEDIVEELNHYDFTDKIVFCNCDNPKQSNFWKYFHLNFEHLKLKKLIATYYEPNNIQSFKAEYSGGNDDTITPLNGDGDFRSSECIDLLKMADVIITNPPFSLFREYIDILMKYQKKFLIIGNVNAYKYKEIFPLIQQNKMWLGYRNLNRDMYFDVPDEHKEWLIKNKKEGSAYKIIDGVVMGRLASACWYTNIDHEKRHKIFDTQCLYNPDIYPKYDSYDAINVNKVAEIPMDYDGIIGVPITFLDKYNPEQFEIVGEFNHGSDGDFDFAKPILNGKELFPRIAIRNKKNRDTQ